MAWFFDEMRKGNYWILKKSGNSYDKVEVASFSKDAKGASLEKGKSQNKVYRKHWDGWLPNVKKIETFFNENGLIEGEFSQKENGEWAVADAVTGATVADFEEYAGILYKAFAK